MEKLRPVIFVKGEYNYHRQNLFQQNLLLKALQVTSDPVELKKMAGLKTVAEVYRTLDKMAIRREYHEALVRQGLDLDTITTGMKELTKSPNDGVKLKAYQALMKSIGIDEYKESMNENSRGWEDIVREHMEKKPSGLIETTDVREVEKYEVKIPEVPADEKIKREAETKTGITLYESPTG